MSTLRFLVGGARHLKHHAKLGVLNCRGVRFFADKGGDFGPLNSTLKEVNTNLENVSKNLENLKNLENVNTNLENVSKNLEKVSLLMEKKIEQKEMKPEEAEKAAVLMVEKLAKDSVMKFMEEAAIKACISEKAEEAALQMIEKMAAKSVKKLLDEAAVKASKSEVAADQGDDLQKTTTGLIVPNVTPKSLTTPDHVPFWTMFGLLVDAALHSLQACLHFLEAYFDPMQLGMLKSLLSYFNRTSIQALAQMLCGFLKENRVLIAKGVAILVGAFALFVVLLFAAFLSCRPV